MTENFNSKNTHLKKSILIKLLSKFFSNFTSLSIINLFIYNLKLKKNILFLSNRDFFIDQLNSYKIIFNQKNICFKRERERLIIKNNK